MEIDHCVFPDDLLYDVENNTWLRVDKDGSATVGVTSVLSAIAGKLVRVRLKGFGEQVRRGQSLGTLESEKFVGPIPSPMSGEIVAINKAILDFPRTINSSPYDKGWIARLRLESPRIDEALLTTAKDSRILLAQKIAQFHVRCFKEFPDREMYEIGTECAAVISKLDEQLATMPIGEFLHLVSDDPTAYVEMVAWADRTGQRLLDWRKEGNLYHFIVERVR